MVLQHIDAAVGGGLGLIPVCHTIDHGSTSRQRGCEHSRATSPLRQHPPLRGVVTFQTAFLEMRSHSFPSDAAGLPTCTSIEAATPKQLQHHMATTRYNRDARLSAACLELRTPSQLALVPTRLAGQAYCTVRLLFVRRPLRREGVEHNGTVHRAQIDAEYTGTTLCV